MISVVMICNHRTPYLLTTIDLVQQIAGEILVYNTGDEDLSKLESKWSGIRVISAKWEGYGRTRYLAAQLARYDWILMLDSDEVPDDTLLRTIKSLDLSQKNCVYNLKYRNFLGSKEMKFGAWGNDSHIRMGNRTMIKTDQEIVHEKLFLHPDLKIVTLEGYINHYTARDMIAYTAKLTEYADLSAQKFYRLGKTAGLKLYLSPLFAFLRNYIFKFGILDGREGFQCAWIISWYTFLKYARLEELYQAKRLKINIRVNEGVLAVGRN